MTSWCPQTCYEASPDQWDGGDKLRFATEAEAEAFLASIRPSFPIIATRIIPSDKPLTMVWYFDLNMMGKPKPPKNKVRPDKQYRPRNYRHAP